MTATHPAPRFRITATLASALLFAIPGLALASTTMVASSGATSMTAGASKSKSPGTGFAAAMPTGSGIMGSAHDLTLTGSGNHRTADTTEICVFCHTPHSGESQGLWNRSGSGAQVELYGSAGSNPGGFGPETLFCLSCHDGSTALDQLVNGPGSSQALPDGQQGFTFTGGNTLAPGAVTNLGADMGNDHPVSVTYDAASHPGYNPAVGAKVGTLPLYGANRDQVECTTCHDPHDGSKGTFLRESNSGSAMCKTCHRK